MPSEEGPIDSSHEKESALPRIEPRPKNWLEPVILVSLRDWNSYGYELMERLTQFGFEVMNPGTMYRTLRRRRKTATSRASGKRLWEDRHAAGYYVTEAGEMYLTFWVEG